MSVKLEADLCCPICHEIFKDPVILGCSHSFCERCLQLHWTQKDPGLCPLCLRRHSKERLPPNLVVKILCDNFSRGRGKRPELQTVCRLHSQTFKLFCLDHQQLVCVVCRDSEQHVGHKFMPVDEAAAERRDVLQEELTPLKKRLQDLRQVETNVHQMAERMEVQARHTERRMKETYEKLHQFLVEDEKQRMTSLREEEEQKRRMMKETMETLSGQIKTLLNAIRATEEELRDEDLAFLQNSKATLERVQRFPDRDEVAQPSEAHIDMAKHLGNLKYNIWNKMKDVVSYTPLTLDPNSAGPNTEFSDDLTSLVPGKKKTQEYLEKEYSSVIASQGFSSGTHSWDVEVGDNPEWKLGVLTESARNRTYKLSGLWIVGSYNGGYRALTPSHSYTPFSVRTRPQRIRVTLDWNKSQLTFYDLDTWRHIFTFSNKFTEKMFPYFSTVKHRLLRVLPVDIRVNVDPHMLNA
ncbi:unnamed protein product [Ophioblennius macclurei]